MPTGSSCEYCEKCVASRAREKPASSDAKCVCNDRHCQRAVMQSTCAMTGIAAGLMRQSASSIRSQQNKATLLQKVWKKM